MREILPKITTRLTNELNSTFTNLKEWLGSFDSRFSLPTSPTYQIINAIRWVYSQLLYFIEDVASEQNYLTAERPESVYGLASINGHEATRSLSASGIITIQSKQPSEQIGRILRIPNYTSFRDLENNLTYTLFLETPSVSIDLYSNTKIDLFAYQGNLITKTVNYVEKDLFTFQIESSKPIASHPIVVIVNGESWTEYESLYDMSANSKGYILRNNFLGGFNVTFGNSYFGVKPQQSSNIQILYLESDGLDGNLFLTTNLSAIGTGLTNNNQIIELVDYLTATSAGFNFGADAEPIDLTKNLMVKSSQSSLLALSRNYEILFGKFSQLINYIITEKKDESLVQATIFSNFKLKIKNNSDYFLLKESDLVPTSKFITDLYSYVQNSGSVIMTGKLQILTPKIEKFALVFYIKPVVNFDLNYVKINLIDKVTQYLIDRKKQYEIQRSDLIALVEAISGVDSVTVMVAKENATANVNGFGDIELNTDTIAWVTGGFYDTNNVFYKLGVPDGNSTSAISIFFVN